MHYALCIMHYALSDLTFHLKYDIIIAVLKTGGGNMKRIQSLFLAFIMLFSCCTLTSTAFGASKSYAEDRLLEIEKSSGFIPGKDAAVLNNCYGFVSAVCEKLFGVQYNGEGLYDNYKAKHSTGNYYTVATFETSHTTPTSEDVENIIAFFTKYAAPGDVVHYGAYNKSVNKTHTFMVQSISNKKMSIFHSNYNVSPYNRAACHIDDLYWDSFRESPTKTARNSDGSLYSLNAMFYATMQRGGIGITINRYSKYEDKYYLVGAAVPTVKTVRSSTDSITVSWDEIIGASKYKVQYKKSGDKSYKTLTSEEKSLSYEVKNLTVGTMYDFRVAAYINGKWGSYSDVVSKDALPPTLTVIKFTPTSTGLKLKWTKRGDISGIRIYRKASDESSYSKIKTVTNNSKGTYIDKKITYGKEYSYKIERYIKTENGEFSTKSKAIKGKYVLQEPTVTYENIHAASVEITLKANGANDAFAYYLTNSKNKNVIPLTKTTDKKITLNNLTVGAEYTFHCRQTTSLGSGEYASVTFKAIPKKEAVKKVWATSKGICIEYSLCSDVDGYTIYKSTEKDSGYKLAGLVDDKTVNTYTDIDVAYNTDYYYKVRSYVKTSKEYVYSELSEPSEAVKNSLSAPESVKATRITPTSIKISWKAVKNADKYIVSYKAEGGSWSKLSAVEAREVTITKLNLGTNYYFRVKAANEIGKGSYCKSVQKTALPPTPSAPKLKNKEKGIKIYWNASEWASGYKIYRATAKSGKYSLVKTIENAETSSWTDKDVKKNKTYYYKTVRYVIKDKTTYNSPKSPENHIKRTV